MGHTHTKQCYIDGEVCQYDSDTEIWQWFTGLPLSQRGEQMYKPEGKFVLWIDDQSSRVEVVKDLIPSDVIVLFAHGVEQINYYLNHFKYMCVVLDHDMPLLDGTTVLQHFDFDDVPIVICSLNLYKADEMHHTLVDRGYNVKTIPITCFSEFRACFKTILGLEG